ncbi:hypothetical protein [Bradyrhizobium sp. USDA 4452]
MCLGCWEEEGKPFKVTDAVRQWAPRFAEADEFGPLHIVVSDWNLEDDNLEFCKNYEGATDSDKALMSAMQAMTWEERWATAVLAQYPDVAAEVASSQS